MTSYADVRARALGPVLYSHAAPKGVLHSTGMAEWPAGATGNGYLNALRTMPFAAYEIFTAPRFLPPWNPLTGAARAHLEALKADLCDSVYGRLNLPGDFDTYYNRGSSFAVQGALFAPLGDTAPYTTYDYAPELQAILAKIGATRTLYAGVGSANHSLSFSGNFDFNNDYPLNARDFNLSNFFISATDALQANSQGLDLLDWICNTQMICADFVVRDWVHTVYDPTHPDVLALLLSSLQTLATAMAATIKYVVQGEGALVHSNVLPPLADPETHYRAGVNPAGFRTYLSEVRGLTVQQINELWNADYASIEDIDPKVKPLAQHDADAVADYKAYLSYLLNEIAIQSAKTVKSAATGAEVTKLTFGAHGCEHGWLGGDFAALGDWHSETAETYRAEKRYHFTDIVAAQRLAGVPGCHLATSPPGIHVANPQGQGAIPPLFRSYREYTRDQVNWFYRESLCMGAVHFGYLRTLGYTFLQHAPSVEAVLGSFEAMALIRAAQLDGMGPYQRIAVHVSELESLTQPEAQDPSGAIAHAINAKLREWHTTAALFSNDRVASRTLAQWWLKRSFLIVPLHQDKLALLAKYTGASWFPSGAAGAALFIAEDLRLPAGLSVPAPMLLDARGALYRVFAAGVATNVYYFHCSGRKSCEAAAEYHAAIANLIETRLRPTIEPSIAQSASDPFVVAPLRIDASNDVLSQFVSDGINFTVAVSNMGVNDVSTSIKIDPRIATALDVTYPASTAVSLLPGETKFVTIEATPAGLNLQTAIADAVANLADGALAAYDATIKAAISSLLTKAEARRAAGAIGRALALYTQAVRTPILKAEYAANSVVIRARKLGLEAEANVLAVSGARVQLLFPLNDREEQPTEGVTDGSGDATIAVGSPVQKRWNFTTNLLELPPANARALVEAHVTDLATGASSRVQFAA